ncbi:MAG: DJ-1/PfpI family protein [Firmicutes bacterium]|nr:DJ-1/PfpI family protein [Bacillota bacterium]
MIYVHLADGFEEIEALTIVDLLRRAELEVQTVSITGSRRVMGTHNVPVEADILFEETDYENCQMIVLPGGMPGAANLGNHEGLTKHIRCFAQNGKYLAAICAAPMVFGALGILEGKKATIYPGMEDHLTGAQHQDAPVVADGTIFTSKGPATAMPFAIKLVETLKGKTAAAKLEEDLLWNQR